MDNENQNTGTPERDDDVLLPEGYDNENIFDEPASDDENIFGKEGTIEGFGGEDEGNEDPAQEDPQRSEDEKGVGDGSGEGSAPEVAHEEKETVNRFKFKDGDQEVELPESEISELFRFKREHGGDTGRIQELQANLDEVNKVAGFMGFTSVKDMLDKMQENYRNAEIKRLIEDPEHPVHPEVAKDMVDRKMKENAVAAAASKQEHPEGKSAPAATARNFHKEMAELLADRPKLREELSKGGKLPQEVVVSAAKNKISLRAAYAEYEAGEARKEAERVKQENAILRQNADAKTRAPIKPVSDSGHIETKGTDPFLDGFESDN